MPSSPGVVRTNAQLQTEFADNNAFLISAQDGRDLIASVFGWDSTAFPNNANDSIDSGGIGAFFDFGSVWVDMSGPFSWLCLDGTPNNAQWHREPQVEGLGVISVVPTYSRWWTYTVSLGAPLPLSYIPPLPGSIITSPIGVTEVPPLDASIIVTGVFAVGLIPGLPGSIITSGMISPAFLPPASVGWTQITINFSDFSAGGTNNFATAVSLSQLGVILAMRYQITTAFTVSAGVITSTQFDSNPAGVTAFWNNSIPATVDPPWVGNLPFAPSVGAWDLTVIINTSANCNITAGSMTIWYFALP